jgi:aspartate-semialdehyde dehydrogenase
MFMSGAISPDPDLTFQCIRLPVLTGTLSWVLLKLEKKIEQIGFEQKWRIRMEVIPYSQPCLNDGQSATGNL